MAAHRTNRRRGAGQPSVPVPQRRGNGEQLFVALNIADEAVRSAAAGYAVVAASPQDGFQGTGLSEFHAFALLAAGHVG
ncbi:hypothetical protein, partial [Mycolicibacterium insubricum]|uniref:hypothetical protein n=1 Tax=Mycolicibacterium insubricum TaxID=444597 RepID=UPI0021F38738